MLKPAIHYDNADIYRGDALEVLSQLPDKSINCCITSPPFWNLRDYGTATWEGGDPECDHVVGEIRTGLGMSKLSKKYRGGGKKVSEPKPMTAKEICPKCGAIRVDQQIGLEPTIEEYIAKMVRVFQEVYRVMTNDSTLWLNMGDSYATGGMQGHQRGEKFGGFNGKLPPGRHIPPAGLKHKDVCGIPWRVAFALQADGWYLRQDIIWSKPAPMPESCTDRCTKSHEYIFLLTKKPQYYYDAEAIKEEASPETHARYARGRSDAHKFADSNQTIARTFEHMRNPGVNPKATLYKMPGGWDTSTGEGGHGNIHKDGKGNKPRSKQNESFAASVVDIVEKRNKRSVWTVSSEPYSEAHFAVYPTALIVPCVRAGCPVGGVILDPFAGSGTTGLVTLENGRKFVGIELNPEYLPMIKKRIHGAATQMKLDL